MPGNPVILVTGASSGIGEATARLFGSAGYRVAMGARRLERLEKVAGEIEAGGGQATAIAADIARLDDIRNLVSTALDRYGQIDVLFNNAGFGRLDWLENLDPYRDIEDQLRVNLIGLIEMTQAVLPHMIARRSGHIVNMSSVAGLVATPTYSVYSAGKFAVRGFSEALRREVGVYGIRVSVIYPGGVRTEFAERAGIKRKTRKTTPASLRLDPEQVAHAVLGVVRRPRRGVILPLPMRLAVWFNVLLPGVGDWIVERRFTRPERLED
jgi:NADP-dependent 3-hydroxy acid dehydrogenase YdfG